MREDLSAIQAFRLKHPIFGYGDTHNGAAELCFVRLNGRLKLLPANLAAPGAAIKLQVIFTNNDGWDHVSCSMEHRCPTWEEMCFVKELFFGDDEAVMQIHPKKKDYVDLHKYCLHLWRPQVDTIPLPDPLLVF